MKDQPVIDAKTSLYRAALKGSAATVVLAMLAGPALAQTVQAPAEVAAAAADAAADQETIVITGSLIRNPNLERSSPVNVTGADEIELLQSNTAEEILREIPGIVPSIGSAVNNGNGGASFVNLRGLGSNRNIVLLDGFRLVPAELNGRVDLNNIPLALVNRVDVLTGGASTTYGADAISGVVNFVTRTDFSGVEATASEQLTEQGDGNVLRTDVTIGANLDDGKGNVVFSIGYQKADPVYQGARSFARNSIESFNVNAGGGSGTAIPSSFAIPGVGTRQIDPATGNLVPRFATFNFNPFNIFQVPFTRYNIYGAGRYEISDAVEVYTRGLFSKNVVQTIIAPSGIFNQAITTNLNNPFLPTGARNTFCARNDFNAAVAGIQTLTQAECDAAALASGPGDPNYRQFTTNVGRRTTEVGPRISDYQTTVFDYQLGLRGGVTDTINWDLVGSYGESQNIQTLKGYVSISRARQAALSNDGVTCQNTASFCSPINLFGPEGSISQAAADFIEVESTTTNRYSLGQVRGTLSGDFGVASPFGETPISFALGAEYRNYNASQQSDLLSQTPGELGGAGGAAPNIRGGYNVHEGYAEIIAPLIEGKPFFESLTLEAGVRYSEYEVRAPGSPKYNTTTYKAGGSWEPGAGLKVRGNYSRAVRAPNIAELFAPQNTGLTNLGTDPCAGAAPLNNATLRAVCLAQGAPAFTIGTIQNPTAGQANATSGGNVDLQPEKSNSYTIGAVFQPEFIPGFSVSVDYYNIKVTGAITTPTPGDAISACFGATPTAPPSGAPTDPDCLVIGRSPVTGGLDGDPADTAGLFLALSNLGKLKTDGIDVTLNYARDLGFANLGLSFTGNWTKSSKFQATPSAINRECTGFYSPNCGSIQPEYQFSQRTTLGFDFVDLSLLWRYQHKVSYEPAQFNDDLAAALADPVGCPNPEGADLGSCLIDPDFRKIKAYHYFDLSARFPIMEQLTLTLAVQNLTDKKPPVVGNTIGSTAFNSGNTYPSSYDALGRRYAASVRLRF